MVFATIATKWKPARGCGAFVVIKVFKFKPDLNYGCWDVVSRVNQLFSQSHSDELVQPTRWCSWIKKR